MIDKIKNLFDVKLWVENFISKMVVSKGVKHGVTVVVGLLGSAVFTLKVKPVLDQLGVSIDTTKLSEGLTVFFGAAAGWLVNWAIKVMEHDKPKAA